MNKKRSVASVRVLLLLSGKKMEQRDNNAILYSNGSCLNGVVHGVKLNRTTTDYSICITRLYTNCTQLLTHFTY